MTDFMDPTVGNQRRQQLLQWMLQQGAGQQNTAAPTGMGASMAPTPLGIGMAAARGGFGAGAPAFDPGHAREGGLNFTNARTLAPGLLARLGPGGAGHGPHSGPPGPGLPVLMPSRSMGAPHQSTAPSAAPLPVLGNPASPAPAVPAELPAPAAPPAGGGGFGGPPPPTPAAPNGAISALPVAPHVAGQPAGGLSAAGLGANSAAAIAAIQRAFGITPTVPLGPPVGPTFGATQAIGRIGY